MKQLLLNNSSCSLPSGFTINHDEKKAGSNNYEQSGKYSHGPYVYLIEDQSIRPFLVGTFNFEGRRLRCRG